MAFGVPVTQDGLFLTIPGLTLMVAEECSSIRSSSMLLVTTMVLAQLLLRSTWRKALLIAIAVPLSVAKNGLRIFAIAMLGTRVDPRIPDRQVSSPGRDYFFRDCPFRHLRAALGLKEGRRRYGIVTLIVSDGTLSVPEMSTLVTK